MGTGSALQVAGGTHISELISGLVKLISGLVTLWSKHDFTTAILFPLAEILAFPSTQSHSGAWL